MPKKLSPTEELAIWFVENYLNEHFDYRQKTHRNQLRAAKELVNPGPDPITGQRPPPYSVEEIKSYIIALRDGTSEATDYLPFEEWATKNRFSDPKMRSLRILTWEIRGRGRTFISVLSEVPDPPPVYHREDFAEWVKKHGRRAYEQGKWDGLFRWFPDETPAICPRMSMDEFEAIMGTELTVRSVDEWNRGRDRGIPRGI